MKAFAFRSIFSGLFTVLLLGNNATGANLPGGGTGDGPDVTVTENGDGTVTMSNGIASIVIVTKTSRLNEVTCHSAL